MNQNNNNDFQQYGFDQYSQQPSAAQRDASVNRLMGPTIGQTLKSPIVATAALLLVGATFAGIIIASYPSSDKGDVPVVKAETLAYKSAPAEEGGMQIDNRDSTIFESMQGAQEIPHVENLLSDDEGTAKFEEFARQVEEAVEQEKMSVQEALAAAHTGDVAEEPVDVAAMQADIRAPEAPEPSELSAPTQVIALQKIEPAAVPEKVASAETPKVRIHRAGENPETLDFVRSVLDKKDSKVASGTSAQTLAQVAPAAGTAGVDIQPGTYYVQLASVRTADGAASEWGKLQDSYGSLLSNVSHRVKSADLGERGMFYRIQAGPMSKDSANRLCDQIKVQKPGGCLVTQ